MRIERVKKGWRVRVLFNRGELRDSTREARRRQGALPEALAAGQARVIPLFVRPPRPPSGSRSVPPGGRPWW